MRNEYQEWFVSAPYDPVRVRRGDPLGFRQTADWYADLLAPGLSNRTIDARWVTLLLWVLHKANGAWQHFHDGVPLDSATAARQYYGWVKPLELLWVARTAKLCKDRGNGRQLPGIRGVNRWLDKDGELLHFGLSTDQYSRYRQTGIYGSYRVLLRQSADLTINGDGFRPTRSCAELIELVEQDVPHIPRRNAWRKRIPNPERYWVEAWAGWSRRKGSQLLPTPLDQTKKLRDKTERGFLNKALFEPTEIKDSGAEKRRQVALLLGKIKAKDHYNVCLELAARLRPKEGKEQLEMLPHFSDLADAGVNAMDSIWQQLADGPRQPLKKVAVGAEAELEDLQRCAAKWQKLKRPNLPGGHNVDALAASIARAKSDLERVVALLHHHELLGGGLRWVSLEPKGTHLVRVAPERLTQTARYRFRLYPLARLARQCGLIDRVAPALSYSPGDED
jgi:hypothetical protein